MAAYDNDDDDDEDDDGKKGGEWRAGKILHGMSQRELPTFPSTYSAPAPFFFSL